MSCMPATAIPPLTAPPALKTRCCSWITAGDGSCADAASPQNNNREVYFISLFLKIELLYKSNGTSHPVLPKHHIRADELRPGFFGQREPDQLERRPRHHHAHYCFGVRRWQRIRTWQRIIRRRNFLRALDRAMTNGRDGWLRLDGRRKRRRGDMRQQRRWGSDFRRLPLRCPDHGNDRRCR